MVFVRGVEIVFFEFKELILDLAMKTKDCFEPKISKPKFIVKRFLEDVLIKKLSPYIKFNIQAGKGGSAPRFWPESSKDKEIKIK